MKNLTVFYIFFPEKRNCMRRIRGMIMLLYTSRSRKHWNML